jgi:hypothetical protein
MSAAEIYVHSVTRIAAARKESNGSVWVDLRLFSYDDNEIAVTLFPRDGPDPRFAALAEFIAATWPEEEKAPTEPEPAVDQTDDMPF